MSNIVAHTKGITLSAEQDTAVREFRDWYKGLPARMYDDVAPYYLQNGFAGTGKSTVLPFFIESIGVRLEDVTFVAPTGKAAKVMTKKLAQMGIFKQAVTIHKAMYRPKGLAAFAIEEQINFINKQITGINDADEVRRLGMTLKILHKDLDRAYQADMPRFQMDPNAEAMREPMRLIVCDECSMVSEEMADDMLSYGTPVLAIGDPGQLQPVGGLPGFMIRPANHTLTEIHRQAADNPIIALSMMIREGKAIPYGTFGDSVRIIRPKDDDVTYDLERDLQVICGTNVKRWNITRKSRKQIGLDGAGPSAGEMMIVTKNSRKYPSLVNGTILQVNQDTGQLNGGDVTYRLRAKDEDGFDYDLRCIQAILEETYLGKGEHTASKSAVFHAKQSDLNHQADFAYAITCHKSQGSQWNEVVVHDESNSFREQSQQWLYTAVTRASERLTLVMKD